MPSIPASFTQSLASQFNARLRVRWSLSRDTWQIEQRVARAIEPGQYVREIDDRLIRYRDGYDLFCEIAVGDRIPCRKCHATIALRPYAFHEASCPRCSVKGGEGMVTVGFWPLGDALLEHLRLCDPERVDLRARLLALDRSNERLEQDNDSHYATQRQDILKDGLITEQIPKVGYGALTSSLRTI